MNFLNFSSAGISYKLSCRIPDDRNDVLQTISDAQRTILSCPSSESFTLFLNPPHLFQYEFIYK